MPLMPPGSQTGVYYIPVGNLPWNTTWKKLKLHARNRQPDGSGLAILHANVYPGSTSTSGWVSVQGLTDFRKAVYHMNTSPMEDRPRAPRTLQADGRNEELPVMLGEDSPEISSPIRLHQRGQQQQTAWQAPPLYANASNAQTFDGDWSHHHATPIVTPTPMSPSFSELFIYEPPAPHYNLFQPLNGFAPRSEYGRSTQPGKVFSPMPPPLTCMSQGVFVSPGKTQAEPMLQMFTPHAHAHAHAHIVEIPQPQPLMMLPSPQIPQIYPSEPTPKVVKTEARKIIITGLPLTASRKGVEDLIQSVSSIASPSSSSSRRRHHRKAQAQAQAPDGNGNYLQHLELAKHPNGAPKGHAFAILESHSTAKRTIDALNGMSWQGRKLNARFAKEGVESRSRGTKHGQSAPADHSSSSRRLDCVVDVTTSPHGGNCRGPYGPRTTIAEPRYTGDDQGSGWGECASVQSANIPTDSCGDDWSDSALTLLSKSEPSVSSLSLSGEGERERHRRMMTGDDADAGSHTPVVADGSFCGKKHR